MKTEMKRSILPTLAGGLLVSCQAPDGDPFCDPESMARFAQAAERGGAVGIRVNGPSDIRAVKRATSLPVLGIQKRNQDGKLLITPFFDDARELVRAGAEIIAVECTTRTRQWGALDLVRRIRAELNVAVMADIATLEEALAARRRAPGDQRRGRRCGVVPPQGFQDVFRDAPSEETLQVSGIFVKDNLKESRSRRV